MMRVTFWARPLPYRQRHFRDTMPTGGTRFAAGIPAAYDDDRLAPLSRLVFQLTAKFAKAHVGNRPSQLVVFKHARNVQILDGHDIETIDEIGGELVQSIGPNIRNPRMKPGHAPLSFLHILRPRDVHAFRNVE